MCSVLMMSLFSSTDQLTFDHFHGAVMRDRVVAELFWRHLGFECVCVCIEKITFLPCVKIVTSGCNCIIGVSLTSKDFVGRSR